MHRLIELIRRHTADILLILSLLFVSLAVFVTLSLFRTGGESVEITKGGEYLMTVSLFENGEYEIGEGNILVVEDGEAYMKWADCPDGTCVLFGRISLVGESIVCLPNRVTATVIGSGGGDLIS